MENSNYSYSSFSLSCMVDPLFYSIISITIVLLVLYDSICGNETVLKMKGEYTLLIMLQRYFRLVPVIGRMAKPSVIPGKAETPFLMAEAGRGVKRGPRCCRQGNTSPYFTTVHYRDILYVQIPRQLIVERSWQNFHSPPPSNKTPPSFL